MVAKSGAVGRREFLVASAAAAGTMALAARAAEPQQAIAEFQAARSIPLWPNGTPTDGYGRQEVPADFPPVFLRNVETPRLHVFRPEKPNGRALLVIPGGSYTFVSFVNEGVDIARDMTARGYTVFVLVYRLPGEGWKGREDVPLQDAQRAMRLIRSLGAEMAFDPDQVYAVGFSAGGHLAASLATGFGEAVYAPRDALDSLPAKPRVTGLIYPVISHTPGVGHAESTFRLLGPEPTRASILRRSPDVQVSAQTPPLFLLHAIDDTAVPIENSLLMLAAMRARQRPVEAHFFERGGHGFGPGVPGQPSGSWLSLFSTWMDSHAG